MKSSQYVNLLMINKENRSLCGIIAKVLDCGLNVSEFNLQSCNCIHFWTNTLGKGIEPPYPLWHLITHKG